MGFRHLDECFFSVATTGPMRSAMWARASWAPLSTWSTGPPWSKSSPILPFFDGQSALFDQLCDLSCGVHKPHFPMPVFPSGSGHEHPLQGVRLTSSLEIRSIFFCEFLRISGRNRNKNPSAKPVVPTIKCQGIEKCEFGNRAFPMGGFHEGNIKRHFLPFKVGGRDEIIFRRALGIRCMKHRR